MSDDKSTEKEMKPDIQKEEPEHNHNAEQVSMEEEVATFMAELFSACTQSSDDDSQENSKSIKDTSDDNEKCPPYVEQPGDSQSPKTHAFPYQECSDAMFHGKLLDFSQSRKPRGSKDEKGSDDNVECSHFVDQPDDFHCQEVLIPNTQENHEDGYGNSSS
ncbi:uncharacterized protein LOC108150871 [Drosophila miranda]|uniref:uncharacterized protein LOC108150871 n=1 Tax=Drosophila miranda TaxID=7229 RepID=UPI0007E709ED|nr:uncharacterized protein LOC108150871 [Drosophila miranda]